MRDETSTERAEPIGVGAIRTVRTFRVGHDGGLYPVNTATAWTPAWNTATCARGRAHTPPDPDCRCGFYVYFHPAYTFDQPPARQVLAVVEVRGVMEAATRGARVAEARIVGVWLGAKVSEPVAEQVAAHYPHMQVFRDAAVMLEALPLTPVAAARAPRLGSGPRALLRSGLWGYAAAAAVLGLLPVHAVTRSAAGGALWLTMLATAFALLAAGLLLVRSPMIACVGSSAAAWLSTANLMHTPVGIAYRALLPAAVLWLAVVWRRAARPGRVIREDRGDGALSALRHWWFRRVDGR